MGTQAPGTLLAPKSSWGEWGHCLLQLRKLRTKDVDPASHFTPGLRDSKAVPAACRTSLGGGEGAELAIQRCSQRHRHSTYQGQTGIRRHKGAHSHGHGKMTDERSMGLGPRVIFCAASTLSPPPPPASRYRWSHILSRYSRQKGKLLLKFFGLET